ncbi:hypothetical protein TNCV_3016521 [Trichonephila clavipes]|nr:hypothetical protein TNCV_3016521 [Trichonephila clavipes]
MNSRSRFVGHMCCMDLSSLTIRERIFNYKPIETRTNGRPKLRWVDCVEEDSKVLRVTNWGTVAKLRSEWKRVLEKTWAHLWLLCQ